MLYGQTRDNIKSRFFDELPNSALKWLTPQRTGLASSWGGSSSSGGLGASGANPAWRSTAKPSAGGATQGGAYRAFSSKPAPPVRFANPVVPNQRQAAAHGLKNGMAVFHAKFGEGRVLMLEGNGDDARAQINFTRHGVKWLALSVAKLTVM